MIKNSFQSTGGRAEFGLNFLSEVIYLQSLRWRRFLLPSMECLSITSDEQDNVGKKIDPRYPYPACLIVNRILLFFSS